MAGVEQQVGGQQTVVGAQEGQVTLQVLLVEDLPERGREEGLHANTPHKKPTVPGKAQGHVSTAPHTYPAPGHRRGDTRMCAHTHTHTHTQ